LNLLEPRASAQRLHRHSGVGRNPVTEVIGYRETQQSIRLFGENHAMTPLDSGLRRNDGEG